MSSKQSDSLFTSVLPMTSNRAIWGALAQSESVGENKEFDGGNVS